MTRVALAFLLLWPGLASAVFLPIDVDSCHNLAATETSCNVVTRATAAGFEDGARDCLASPTQGFACRFAWPTNDPASLTPTVWWGTPVNGATSGSACFGVKVACCAGNNCQYEDIAFGGVKLQSGALSGSSTTLIETVFTDPVSPATHAAGAVCWLWVERVSGNGSCGNTISDANGSGVSIKRIDLE